MGGFQRWLMRISPPLIALALTACGNGNGNGGGGSGASTGFGGAGGGSVHGCDTTGATGEMVTDALQCERRSGV
jgi:hypothetical protein